MEVLHNGDGRRLGIDRIGDGRGIIELEGPGEPAPELARIVHRAAESDPDDPVVVEDLLLRQSQQCGLPAPFLTDDRQGGGPVLDPAIERPLDHGELLVPRDQQLGPGDVRLHIEELPVQRRQPDDLLVLAQERLLQRLQHLLPLDLPYTELPLRPVLDRCDRSASQAPRGSGGPSKTAGRAPGPLDPRRDLADRLLLGDLRVDPHELPVRHRRAQRVGLGTGPLLETRHQRVDGGEPTGPEILELGDGPVGDTRHQHLDLVGIEPAPQRRPELERHRVPDPPQLPRERLQLLRRGGDRLLEEAGQRTAACGIEQLLEGCLPQLELPRPLRDPRDRALRDVEVLRHLARYGLEVGDQLLDHSIQP